MKLLLVFALCGVTCCLAGSACSKDEIRKCSEGLPYPRGTEGALDYTCKIAKCLIEVYERCGKSAFELEPFGVKGSKKFVSSFCDGSSPLRKKFLDNAECIRSVTKYEDMERLRETCGLKNILADRDCRKISKGYFCAMNYIIRNCGKDAGDVFAVSALPSYDPYDCLTTFEK